MNHPNVYKKKDLLKFFDFITSRLPDTDEQYVIAIKTTLHDIDLQNKENIVKYIECLKKMFEPLDDNCGIQFQCSITPYNAELMNLQPEFDNHLKVANEQKTES